MRKTWLDSFGATMVSICTGILERFAASTSEGGKGIKRIPYWRTLKVGE
jgi:hypothetical protein